MHVGVGDAGVRKCLSPRVVLDYRGHLESDWCVRICVCVWFIDVHRMQFQMCAAFFGLTGGSSMGPVHHVETLGRDVHYCSTSDRRCVHRAEAMTKQ